MTTMTHALSREQVEAFDRDGCLVGLSPFTEPEAARWADEVRSLSEDGIAGHPAPWNQKTYLLLPSLDGIVRDRRLTDLVADILGEDLLALSADVFVKAPHSSRRITWHQDVNYWDLEPFDMLTAWVALTPATPENGGMRYGRGGHRGRLEHVEHPDESNILSRGQELAVEVAPEDIVEVTLRPGQVSLHHALAPHASGPNTTGGHRIGFAIRYASAAVAQRGGPTISARLARGADLHGNFPLEPGPDAPLSSQARAAHAAALAPHAASGYSTV